MEISLQISQAPEPNQPLKAEDVFMTCAFTMVSLDPATKEPTKIPPLELETPAERALFAKGEENYKAKRALKESNIMQSPPDASESALIHNMWTERLAYADSSNPTQMPPGVYPMLKTTIHSTQIMQPQYRNRHNFMIFGGYLLKTTFELAFTCAASFSHSRPRFLNLDPSNFKEPVPVGSVLYVSAGVTYTEVDPANPGTRVQVMVRTHVRNVEHAETQRKSTGTFFYTFHVDSDVSVLPHTYGESMRWVGGRRRAITLTKKMKAEAMNGGSTLLGAAIEKDRVTE